MVAAGSTEGEVNSDGEPMGRGELPVRPKAPAAADWLALERTELANERTLLAWARTGLGFGAAGATVAHFSGGPRSMMVGVALVVSGAALGLMGIARYTRVRVRFQLWRRAWAASGAAVVPEFAHAERGLVEPENLPVVSGAGEGPPSVVGERL